MEDDDGELERGKREEKRRPQDGKEEVSSDIHQSESSDCSHNTNNEDIEDDEGLRPAKRRKLPLQPTHKALTPPLDHNSKVRLREPHSVTPPLATQLEVDDVRPQADHLHPPIFSDDDYHYPPPSRSPFATTESIPLAEYEEWPFQGFLKRTKIGDDITFNLEFKFPPVSQRLDIPIDPELLGMCSGTETSANVAIPHEAAAYSKIRQAPLRPQKKRVRWTPEEDATVLEMRNDGCSWEDIHAALPNRSKETIQVRYSTKLKK